MAKNRIVFSNNFILKDEKVGINTSSPRATLDVVGNIHSSGIVTSLGGFVGNLTGNLTGNITGTVIGIASTARSLETPRNFSVSGDVATTSPVSFNGTSNVNLSVGLSTTFSANTSGIITASRFSTGASGTGINFDTNTITGPSILYIDPAVVGNDSGAVRIKGDLYVDGTEFIVNSTTIDLADYRVGIATTVGTNVLLDGAGIGVGSTNIRKTFTYNNTSTAFESSIGLAVTVGGEFKTGTDSVLNRTTLGPTVINSSLTSLGTLANLNVSGISTLGSLKVSSGVLTATSGIVTYYGDGQYLQNLPSSGIVVQENNTNQSQFISFYNSIGNTNNVGISSASFVFNPSTTRLGIGTDSPTSNLHVVGNSFVSGVVTATDFNSTSDEILKTNIKTIDNALNVVNELRGVSFNWKETGKGSYGVIAQELESIIPELVSNTDPKTVNYNGIIGILIEAVKELSKQVEELKNSK